ncbi:MAG: ABC transporter ATP-binding protein [Chloroflexi bacterium]|uniref:ABC transporter ATP-binding protein n=1 Tax=Candidatus Flexifilum breve TaxID=3140694 RepID=UPI0031375553|nr:ABC transporter ATP-binding protein [Chloroflexota bacterium]
MRAPIIQVRDLTRVYHTGSAEVRAVNGITLDIFSGAMTAIVGRSGSGKTTFLNLISGLDQPTSGEVLFDGEALHPMNEAQRLRLRQQKIGFVFQSFGLLPLLTAAENIGVPLRMRQMAAKERDGRVTEALSWVGLLDRAQHRPYELSGGEQQRVAIARALTVRPQVILADEPTGQLDSATGRRILDLLRRLVVEAEITVVVVTHDPQTMEEADVVHELHDGQLIATRHKASRFSTAALN